ncbi:DUF599 family protein [Candidatus Bathyarchaeota archaeon]|nr:DUF599 family protein [Candidatus Bathyarchaeota archaeon]
MLHEVAFIVYVSCFFLYRLLLYYWTCKPRSCRLTLREEVYSHWVEERLTGKGNDVFIGIHALRNLIMANSVFVSALLILLGIIIGFYQEDSFNANQTFFGLEGVSLGLVQVITNVGIIFICLYHFIMTIRLAARTSILLTSNPGKTEGGVDLTKETFLSAQRDWMHGIRGIFYMIAAIAWVLNPVFFLLVTIAITVYILLKDLRV